MKSREFIVWILLALLIGVGFGIWVYASHIEPTIYSRMADIERSHGLLILGLTKKEIRVAIPPPKPIPQKQPPKKGK